MGECENLTREDQEPVDFLRLHRAKLHEVSDPPDPRADYYDGRARQREGLGNYGRL